MSDGMKLIMSKDGTFKEYDDTYDIVIHCESKEEHDRFIQKFNSMSWIPCSERLPEMRREDMEAEGEYYMISNQALVTDGNKIYVAEYEEDDGYRYGWHSLDGEDYENIIAWMPLPESYNPERSGK